MATLKKDRWYIPKCPITGTTMLTKSTLALSTLEQRQRLNNGNAQTDKIEMWTLIIFWDRSQTKKTFKYIRFSANVVAKISKNLKDYRKISTFEIRSVVLEKFGFEKMAAARLGISMSNHSSDY